MNFEKLLAGQVFKNKISVGFIIIFFKIVHLRLLLYTLCCIYLLLLLISCFYFLTPINFVTQPRYSQRSRKKCHEQWSHWRIKNRRIKSVDVSYHLCYTECMSKIMERSCIVIPENFKQEVLKDGFLRKKQIGNHQLRRDKAFPS